MKDARSKVSFRQMEQGEEADVVNLVLTVFMEFVATHFSVAGISEFKKYANESALAERFKAGNRIVVAQIEKEIIGVIEIRDNSHIALLFVKKAYQRKGVGRKLIHEAIGICRKRNPKIQKITVNASPNAYNAYLKLGFKGENVVQTVNGIRFVPLDLEINNDGFSSHRASIDSQNGALGVD